MQKSYCYTPGVSIGVRMQNVRANVKLKVLEFKTFCIFSCILSLLIILIKPLTAKSYDGGRIQWQWQLLQRLWTKRCDLQYLPLSSSTSDGNAIRIFQCDVIPLSLLWLVGRESPNLTCADSVKALFSQGSITYLSSYFGYQLKY